LKNVPACPAGPAIIFGRHDMYQYRRPPISSPRRQAVDQVRLDDGETIEHDVFGLPSPHPWHLQTLYSIRDFAPASLNYRCAQGALLLSTKKTLEP